MSHEIIKNRDIVLFSLQPWDSNIAFNFKEMAFELARNNRVIFIDRATDRHTILKKFLHRKRIEPQTKEYLELIQENFWLLRPKSILESGNWSPNYRLFDFFNKINNRRLA